ncbi:MAG: hypothetical protein KGP14_00445 [Betaproteobacteria bacterium]|nr:hypothetical protein [Betaproteobacteria bacterium]
MNEAPQLRISWAIASALPDAIVIPGHKMSVSIGRQRFVSEQPGKSIIWISQGPAWTGLDIPDNKLTDLFIAKLPMPPPRPKDKNAPRSDYQNNRARMHIQLKQGIGRLVRSRNATAKRLWCLDPMYADPKFGTKPIFEPYKTLDF